ncbi:MAG: Dabb family protein [Eubacteriales bacterium]|nr:Dabb family protein [Eubacteriales bacterium]
MVTHIVMWNFLDTLSQEEKTEAKALIKERLEALKEEIPGVVSLKVVVNPLSGSTKDIALIGEYESAEALQNYAVHPAHLEVGSYIKTVTCGREAFDF